MELLLNEIERLKKSEVSKLVDTRMKEFSEFTKKSNDEIFNELCFCILTANFNAERSIKMQDAIGSGFCDMPENKLSKVLRRLGHRFYKRRVKYIVEARKHKNSLKSTLGEFNDERELRAWIAENVKGLGYKEASHFLRNIGYRNLAIIDFHIIDVLVRYGLIERMKTKTPTPKKYIEIEKVLKEIAEKTYLTLAELDLYLWYMETGKILK